MDERMIFLQALDKENAAQQAAYLAEACGGDAKLQERVEKLLQSHREAGSFLATQALEEAAWEPQGAAHQADELALDFLVPSQRPGSLGRLDHYEVLGIVGRGGMGVVLRAFDEKLHRVVALKVMAREIAGSAQARKRFSREAKAAAAVVHDHIVPIHAIEEAGPVPYLVMQYIEGKSLQQEIDDEGSLELKECLRIGMQIASGLAAAHKQGLVHRDIKPANILLENGVHRVKITDFGLARAVDDASASLTGVVAGTPQYMSPEQADGKFVDYRSDLFSLGSVLYAMCTGRPPFRASTTVATLKRVCEAIPRPIRELNPEMPDWWCNIVTRLLAKQPADRFGSASEVSELLEKHLANLQNPNQEQRSETLRLLATPSRSPAGSPKPGRRWLMPAGLVLLLIAAVWFGRAPHYLWNVVTGGNKQSLDGRWVFVAAEYKGRTITAEEAKDRYPSELLFKGDQYGLSWGGKQHEGGFRVNGHEHPAEMDFSGSVFEGLKPRKAIYELSGDRLKLCMAFVGPKADPPRPTTFQTDPQSKNVVLDYRREDLPLLR